MSKVVPFVQPLQWVLELDVSPYEARLVAEVLASGPKRHPAPTYRYFALRLCIVQACVVSDDVRSDLDPLIKRCRPLSDRRLVVAGAALVARQPRDEATTVALRRLARDPRILERLGLAAEHRSAAP